MGVLLVDEADAEGEEDELVGRLHPYLAEDAALHVLDAVGRDAHLIGQLFGVQSSGT